MLPGNMVTVPVGPAGPTLAMRNPAVLVILNTPPLKILMVACDEALLPPIIESWPFESLTI